MASNKDLNKLKSNPDDEFYTRLSDINAELKHYKHHFKDKVVLCNCDDPRVSNFFHFGHSWTPTQCVQFVVYIG